MQKCGRKRILQIVDFVVVVVLDVNVLVKVNAEQRILVMEVEWCDGVQSCQSQLKLVKFYVEVGVLPQIYFTRFFLPLISLP